MSLHGRLAEHEVARISAFDRPRATRRSTSSSPRRELAELGRNPVGPKRSPDELLDDAAGDGGCEQRVAARDDVDRLDEPLGRRVLQQEPAGAGPERLVHVLVEVERREHQHLRLRRAHEQPARRLDPVEVRHPDVHQRHVDRVAVDALERLEAVARLRDDLDVVLGVEDHPEAGANQSLVVDERTRTGLAEEVTPPRLVRQPRTHGVAAAPLRPGLERAAEEGDPLAHPDEAVSDPSAPFCQSSASTSPSFVTSSSSTSP